MVICHFPQGCSKYNPIEHVVFSQVSLQMRAHPLISFDVFAELINATKTKTGLYVHAYVAERSVEDWCEKTKPVSASEMASINIEFYPPYQAQKPEESKKWNYVISPTSRRRTVHFEHYGQYAKCCSKFFDLCGRLPCFDAHCYNAPYIIILCGMLDMSRRKTSKPKQIEAFVKNGDLNNRILHRKFQFRAKPCLHCAA